MKDTNCIFCKIINKEIPSDLVYEDDKTLAFKDINPQAPVHVLIIPKKHISDLNCAEESDGAVFAHMLLVARGIAKKLGIAESGYRVVLNVGPNAGQVVFHIHIHLLGGRTFSWPPG